MSENEDLDDIMDELQEIIAEYETKAKEEESAGTTYDKPKLEPVPMDKVIFHDKAGLLKNLARAVETKILDQNTDNEDVKEESADPVTVSAKGKPVKRKPAWTDADDEHILVGEVLQETKRSGPLDHLRKDKTYKEYLTARFTRLSAQPKWASLEHKPRENAADDDELLRTVGFLAQPARDVLSPQNINCKRLKDLNRATYGEGKITSIQFHPTSTAALVAGESAVATIYGIDGRENEKLHSIFFKDFPIKCARITPCGAKAVFGSIRDFYYGYDLLSAQEHRHRLPRGINTMRNFEVSPCGRYMAVVGRFGELHLFHLHAQEILHTFRQNDPIAAVRFSGNSQQLICSSKSSKVNIFSLRQQRLEHSFIDDGCINGSVLDLSPNQRMLATGSMEGIVNVYDFEGVQKSRTPQPEKILKNLTTAISDVRFNNSSELLAFCSNSVPQALRMAHFPSGTVYANFPVFDSKLGRVNTMSFSPSSGYMAIGDHTKAPLFRLKYFENY